MQSDPNVAINGACPRCGATFHCGVTDAAPCACSTVMFAPATLQTLREQYSRCLCLNCLKHFQSGPDGA